MKKSAEKQRENKRSKPAKTVINGSVYYEDQNANT